MDGLRRVAETALDFATFGLGMGSLLMVGAVVGTAGYAGRLWVIGATELLHTLERPTAKPT